MTGFVGADGIAFLCVSQTEKPNLREVTNYMENLIEKLIDGWW